MHLTYTTMPSPVGELKLLASDKGLTAILWESDDPNRVKYHASLDTHNPILRKTEEQLTKYFAGKLQQFYIPLDFAGTPFQQSVWQALLTIPFGETRSYKQIAQQIGNPKAVRAVGGAIGKNPISIIAPCHRVIGANGTLTGFAGGLATKTYLLKLEAS